MLYQLSYASPAQTEQKYHRGNRIASEYLAPLQNTCQHGTYSPPPCLPGTLLRPGLRKLRTLDRHVMLYFRELDRES
jgi:hypothetical protein